MWAMAKEPLMTSLLKLKDQQEQEQALLLFKLVRSGAGTGCMDVGVGAMHGDTSCMSLE